MREIRFRGLRVDGGGWVYGNIIATENGQRYVFNKHFVPAKSVPSVWFIEVTPESVGQFTGLQDKNGVDVYEGDILQYDFECNTVIYWCSESSRFMDKRDFDGDSFTLYDDFGFVIDCKIIGNIHETK